MLYPFASQALCYALGGRGAIRPRGSQGRVWIRLRRPETESTYLEHQSRVLRKLHPTGKIKIHWLRHDTDGFYDDVSFEFQDNELWPAYDLLHYRDKPFLSEIALKRLGVKIIAGCWCDTGVRTGSQARITLTASQTQVDAIQRWTQSIRLPARVRPGPGKYSLILTWQDDTAAAMIRTIRPLVHPSLRSTLRVAGEAAGPPYAELTQQAFDGR